MPKYKLTYFDLRGRAETTRLLFTVSGVAFEDERIGQEQWRSIKHSKDIRKYSQTRKLILMVFYVTFRALILTE